MGKKQMKGKKKATVAIEAESELSEGQAEKNLEEALGNAFANHDDEEIDLSGDDGSDSYASEVERKENAA